MKNHRGLNISTVLKTLKKKNKLFFVLLLIVLTGALALSSVPVHASEEVIQVPQAFVTPNVEIINNSSPQVVFNVQLYGDYNNFVWQGFTTTDNNWHQIPNSSNVNIIRNNWASTSISQVRVRVEYNTGSGIDYIYSNTAYVYNEDNTDVPQIIRFSDFANLLLSSFIEWFDIALDFMINNPIVFVGLFMVLIVAAIGILRHLVGGSDAEKIYSN